MYCPDVVYLKQFYASPLGQVVSAHLLARMRELWPDATGESVLGLGFAVPYFVQTPGPKELVVGGMPAAQGALYWPADSLNRVALLDEASLPFPDNTFNRLLLVHTLEHTALPQHVLQEVWRVLVPGGRALMVVPNRLGIWSHASGTPFGSGQPFSLHQMKALLEQSGLTTLRHQSSLFFLPSARRWLLATAPTLELIGRMLLPALGGVLLVEAEKQIYAALREPVYAGTRRGRTVIPAAAHPARWWA